MVGKEIISKKKFHWLYLGGVLLILALPLLALPPLFHPPAWGKTIIFRIVFSQILLIFFWQLLRYPAQRNQIFLKIKSVSLLFWLLITFGGISLLSTIFSKDPYFSFFGSPYRAGGTLNFLFYLIFAIFLFLILSAKDWQGILNFTFFVAILVASIAILQYFHIFAESLLPYGQRPPSTTGNAIFLAIYLLLLIFLALSFALKSEKIWQKIFYFGAIILFSFVILISQTRAAYLGLVFGFSYFLIFYPTSLSKNPKRIVFLKILFSFFLISGLIFLWLLNLQPEFPEFIKENRILSGIFSRLSFKLLFEEPRFSGWKVSWQAIKEKPLFGWGPENFSIAFDKYYDPHLPQFTNITWWDRAHNFVFDIGVTNGIPALIIYLLLFGVLFWKLEKLKVKPKAEGKELNNAILCQGIQASFLAYLVANFFSFDSFSTYLISFLLIGYSLNLISTSKQKLAPSKKISYSLANNYKLGIISFLFLIFIWFFWSFNLKPLLINKQINWAIYYSENKKCPQALEKMEEILPSKSFINHYLRLRYIDIISNCLKEMPEEKINLAKKAIELLKENTKIRPFYTRNWLLLGTYTNILLANSKEKEIQTLSKEAESYFSKAKELAPKRPEIYLHWAKSDLLSQNFSQAKIKSEYCLFLNPNLAECHWLKGLSLIYLEEVEEAKKEINLAKERGFVINNEGALSQLVKAYINLAEKTKKIEYYQILAELYQKLISLDYNNFQYHASLAYLWKILGEYQKARQEAMIVLKLSPESRENVEEFLRKLER